MKTGLAYLNLPRNGDISITLGVTQGKKERQTHSPEKGWIIIPMSSYRQILYHLIFRTKNGRKTLDPRNSRELYAYLMGIIRNKNCFLYRINGMEDHLHILCDLHPVIALADYMRDIKTSSSIWIKESGKFYEFQGWAGGYAADSPLSGMFIWSLLQPWASLMVIKMKLFQSLEFQFIHIPYEQFYEKFYPAHQNKI